MPPDPHPRPPSVAAVQPLVPAWRLDRNFDYLVPEALAGSLAVGSLVRVPLGGRRVRGIVRSLRAEEDGVELEEVAGSVLAPPLAPPPLDRLLDRIATRYATPRGRVFSRVVPPRVRVEVASVPPRPSREPGAALDRYQGGAELVEAIATGGAGTWSLRFAAAEDRGGLIAALIAACGEGSALIAVPEVHYADLVLGSLAEKVPEAMRIDSSVGDAVRARGLVSLAAGHRVGLGGRAAVLAPATGLRLMVVVDEHHPALKEDRSPRYDARWVAVTRAELAGAVCVLGSAAPSVETSWAARTGRYHRAEPDRVTDRAQSPLVQIAEPPTGGLSRDLHRAIRETLRAGHRVGLLVPVGGFARALWCAACRRSIRCRRCEAGLATERGGSGVICPRCGLRSPAPAACPACGSGEMRSLGSGSERVAAQLERIFPRAKVMRMDPAILSGRDRARSEDAEIYVTTWIGTKPAIRPDVGLVGILDADAWIRRPDFRSAENAYQAFVAMAGWAGPRDAGGRLLIQTREPGHHAIQAVVRADHDHFVERETEARRELGYPPFSELVKVRASGADAGALIDEVRATLEPDDRALGPIDVAGTDGSTAKEVLIKTPDAGRVAEALRVILPRVSGGSRLRIDTDPR